MHRNKLINELNIYNIYKCIVLYLQSNMYQIAQQYILKSTCSKVFMDVQHILNSDHINHQRTITHSGLGVTVLKFPPNPVTFCPQQQVFHIPLYNTGIVKSLANCEKGPGEAGGGGL